MTGSPMTSPHNSSFATRKVTRPTSTAAFDTLLDRLQDLGVTPTACLLDLPPSVSEKLDNGSWPQLLKAKREDWQPQLAYLVSRHAAHLDRWQLGADFTDAFVRRPEM